MPMELRGDNHVSSTDDDNDSSEVTTPVESIGIKAGFQGKEKIDFSTDALMDINRYRFNNRLQNYLHTTCPIVPKFHSTFGEPIERQDISQDIDNGKDTDHIKMENRKIVGRVDKLFKHE